MNYIKPVVHEFKATELYAITNNYGEKAVQGTLLGVSPNN